MKENIKKASEIIKHSGRITAFTGAGISVESGIPPFRGENGLWSKYDPKYIDINYFNSNTKKSWEIIKEIFYDFFISAKPNAAHRALAILEEKNIIQTIITQNIDNLHQEAGSKNVFEFHGNSQTLICLDCSNKYNFKDIVFDNLPPKCSNCQGILKPDFVFFGEPIPERANRQSFLEADSSDLFLLIGTTGEVMPACMFPYMAKQNGAKIIEINIEASNYTGSITDVFLKGRATEMMSELIEELGF